ncbi:MAG: hypothetical protein KAR32_05300, partial [Candidatus Omnitrophica bacterium]|nr:hypothetical protein [Candidatus Omnitrophota bacterium]
MSDQAFEVRRELEFLGSNGDSPYLGTEVWLIDETRELQWTKHGAINTVKIEYSVDGGAYEYVKDPTLPDGAPAESVNGNTFIWRIPIPDVKGQNNVRVKVTDLGNPDVYVESVLFTLRGGFAWDNPGTVNQVMFIKTTTPEIVPAEVLSWTSFGTIPNVDLTYSIDGINGNYEFIQKQSGGDADGIANCTPTAPSLNCTYTFNWNVPDPPSKLVYVRIKDSTDSDAVTTFGPIKIAGKIYIDEPNNVPPIDRWGIGTDQDVKWTLGGTIANVIVEYSRNGTDNWIYIDEVDGSTGEETWSILSDVQASPIAKIRVYDKITDSGTPIALSPEFKIVGSCTVAIPTQTGSSAGILMVSEDGEITTPAIEPAHITWTTAGNVPEVDVYYSTTGAVGEWTLINTLATIADEGGGSSTEGDVLWDVPDDITTTMRIRVQDHSDSGTNNDSGLFTVRGGLKLTSPIDDEKWGFAGGVQTEYQDITWQTNGNIPQVYLDYSVGGSWLPIGAEHANEGSFAWDVPNNMSNTATVRVRNVSGPAIEHVSPNDFKIMARFDMTQPDGGEIATAGQAYTVTWDKWGSDATNVKIDMAIDVTPSQPCSPAYTYDKVIKGNTSNDGTTANDAPQWIVNADWVTPTACVRIYDVNDLDSVNYSANPFSIRAKFTVTGMTEGMNINVSDVGDAATYYDITWNRQGNIPNVKIEYSADPLDGGDLAGSIVYIEPTADGIVPNFDAENPTDTTKGRYVWVVPDIDDDKDTNLHLRISDPDDPGAFIISPAFNVIPRFTVTSPNGDAVDANTDRLEVETPHVITWTSSSDIAKTPQVVISYSTTGGAPFDKAITTTDNDGSYSWAPFNGGVPNDIADEVKIHIEDASDGVAFDNSDYNFKIISDFELSVPNTAITYEVDDTISITWTNTGSPVNNVQLLYSTDPSNDDPALWTDFANAVTIADSTGNNSPFDWPAPDAISSTVRVLVRSLTDDGFDISDVDFRIRGKLNITSPVLNDPVDIGQAYLIQWTSTGTIPNVDIYYDINDGKGANGEVGGGDDYPYTIVAGLVNCVPAGAATTCNGSFDWASATPPNVPDMPTALAKIKIVDSRGTESDVINESPKFNIVGNFTIVSPNDDEDWRVNSTHNITWTWGGTIPVVKLYYAIDGTQAIPTWVEIDPLVTKDYSLDGLQQNGANNSIQRNYLWTVPDDISTTVKVKIEDVNDDTVLDESDDVFKIRGDFLVTSPNGDPVVAQTERWVTYDAKTITWNTDGTISNVYLSYSNNNFGSDIHYFPCADASPTCDKVDALTVSNTGVNEGNYDWDIPDAVLKDGDDNYTNYNLVKVRVEDANDDEVSDESDDPFKIDYYMVTWEVYDLLTNASLSELSVLEVKATDPNWIEWQEVGVTTSGGRIQPTPYGTWVANWAKTGYGDMAQVVMADQDRGYQLYMETTAVHIWRAVSDFAYDPDTDTLDIISFLERDGSVITGVVELNVKFYDGSTLVSPVAPNELRLTGADGTPEGMFPQQWLNTGLLPGKIYAVVTTAEIGTGGAFNSPTSFSITEVAKLDEVLDTVNTKLDRSLSEVEGAVVNAVQLKMDDQLVEIQTKMDTQSDAIDSALDDFTNQVEDSIISLEEAVSDSLASAVILEDAALLSKAAALDLQDIAKRQSAKLLLPQVAITGEPVKLRYRGYSTGLIPLIDILDFENNPIVQAIPMPEIQDKPGLYEYLIEEVDSETYEPGTSFTVIVVEAEVSGSIESGAVYVETASGQLLMPKTVLAGDKVIIQFRGREDWIPVMSLTNFENKKVVDEEKMKPVEDIDGMFEYIIDSVHPGVYAPGKPVTVTVVESTTATVESGTFIVEIAGGQLLMPRTVLVGDKVVIRFRGGEGWKPRITLSDFENEEIVEEEKMDAVKDIEGMFEYTIDSIQSDVYMPGKPVTVTVVEPTTATVESGTFIVESTSLTSLEGLVASGAGVKSVAQDALDAINAVKGTLATGGDVSMALERIKLKINR